MGGSGSLGVNVPFLKKRRDPFWDNAKGILILLVVAGHSLELLSNSFPIVYSFWAIIYAFHMPAFLMISGYMAARSSREPVSRIPKMLLYYLEFQAACALVNLLTGAEEQFTLRLYNPRTGAWYLLFLVYAYLAIHFLREKDPKKVILGSIALGLLSGFDASLDNKAGLVRLFTFFCYFAFGYFVDLGALVKKLDKHRLACGGIFMLTEALIFWLRRHGFFLGANLTFSNPYVETNAANLWRGLLWRAIFYGTGFLLSLCFFTLVSRRNSIITLVGRHSLWLYIIHLVLLDALYGMFTTSVFTASRRRDVVLSVAATLLVIFLIFGCAVAVSEWRKRSRGREKNAP